MSVTENEPSTNNSESAALADWDLAVQEVEQQADVLSDETSNIGLTKSYSRRNRRNRDRAHERGDLTPKMAVFVSRPQRKERGHVLGILRNLEGQLVKELEEKAREQKTPPEFKPLIFRQQETDAGLLIFLSDRYDALTSALCSEAHKKLTDLKGIKILTSAGPEVQTILSKSRKRQEGITQGCQLNGSGIQKTEQAAQGSDGNITQQGLSGTLNDVATPDDMSEQRTEEEAGSEDIEAFMQEQEEVGKTWQINLSLQGLKPGPSE